MNQWRITGCTTSDAPLPPQVEGQNATILTRDANVENLASNLIIVYPRTPRNLKRGALERLVVRFRLHIEGPYVTPSIKMGRLRDFS